MIRQTTRPPTPTGTLPMYIGFMMSEYKSTTCTRLSEVMNISHDSVNRFLWRENSEPEDLFNEAKTQLNLVGGTISVDDTVLDKPYSKHMKFVSHFWSGKHHKIVKGINLITLYSTDVQGQHLPINYRIYDKSDDKTKNDYFQDMLDAVLEWGIAPAFVTGDSWYSCVENLNKVKNHPKSFLFAIESNRTVSIEKGTWIQVQKLDIPENGLTVWLRHFGEVKVFRTQLKDQVRHYIVYLADSKQLPHFERKDFKHQHDYHWQIEPYHRVIKPVCHIEKFQVREKVAIKNHWFAALCGYVHLQKLNATDVLENVYRLQQDLFKDVTASFIKSFMSDKDYLNSQFKDAVNA